VVVLERGVKAVPGRIEGGGRWIVDGVDLVERVDVVDG
jgi:hypothetical protein